MASKAFQMTKSERAFDIFLYVFLTLVMIVTLYPFLNVLAISFNESTDTVRGGIYIWPRAFTLENYERIFSYTGLIQGFKISLLRTLLGTLFGLISASMLAFTLSRPEFRARKFISTFLALTMYFTGGMVPMYILMKDLNLIGTFWIYVLPGMVSAFNVFIIRSFMDGLPLPCRNQQSWTVRMTL